MKNTNPKDALAVKKVPLHAVPCRVLMELGLAMMEGGRKYGTHNYRDMGVRASVYYDAAMRHIMAWWEGEDTDPDSGVHHLIKAMACFTVLRDSMHMGNWTDDRPIQLPNGLDMECLNKQVEAIIKKYPNAVEPYVQASSVEPCTQQPKTCGDCVEIMHGGICYGGDAYMLVDEDECDNFKPRVDIEQEKPKTCGDCASKDKCHYWNEYGIACSEYKPRIDR